MRRLNTEVSFVQEWDRCILCIEPIAELTGKCVVSSWLDTTENVYLLLTERTGI